jgi:hypothetical protein
LEHTAQQISAVKAEFARLRRLTAIGLFIMSLPLYGVVFSLRTGPILGMGANTWLLALGRRSGRGRVDIRTHLALPGMRYLPRPAPVGVGLPKVRCGVQLMPPNTRVQRTRSSPSALRSPLMRCPLGAESAVFEGGASCMDG